MSIFSSIASAVFGKAKSAGEAVAGAASAAASAVTSVGTTALAGGTKAAKPITQEEVEAMIEKIADESGHEDYNWNESIVDLMKLLKLDSSLNARKELAKELGYTGALNGSAEMNVWLHKQVMTKLAESGGVVPASLKA